MPDPKEQETPLQNAKPQTEPKPLEMPPMAKDQIPMAESPPEDEPSAASTAEQRVRRSGRRLWVTMFCTKASDICIVITICCYCMSDIETCSMSWTAKAMLMFMHRVTFLFRLKLNFNFAVYIKKPEFCNISVFRGWLSKRRKRGNVVY